MKIIFIKSKAFCYNSNSYFMEQFCQALNLPGNNSIIMELSELTANISKLKADVIIDFNSTFPNLKDHNGTPLANKTDAVFFNYILDHPLYHHESLCEKIDNYNVICLDDNHAEYIKTFYPHIKNVMVLPLSGISSDLNIPFSDRPYNITFSGTYTNSEAVLNIIKNFDSDYAARVLDIIYKLKLFPDYTLENLLLSECGSNPDPQHFALAMHTLFPADMYITAFFREKVIENLLMAGINVDIFGDGWENFYCFGNPHLTLHKSIDYSNSGDIAAKSRFYLNINPWFKSGIHDRVFTAMQNGAIAFTDKSKMISRYFTNKKDIVLFDLNDLGQCPDIYLNLIKNPEAASAIAEAGHQNHEKFHSYSSRASALDFFLRSLTIK